MPVQDLFVGNTFHLVPRTLTAEYFFCFSEIQTVNAYNVSSHSETWLRTREELTHASGLNKLHVIKINDCKRFLWVYCDWTFSSIQQYINNSRHLARKYARIFVRTLSVPRSEEQIISKGKYPSIFLPQMETIVFITLQIFFATFPEYRKLDYNKDRKAQKITHTLAIFVDHGIMAHIP